MPSNYYKQQSQKKKQAQQQRNAVRQRNEAAKEESISDERRQQQMMDDLGFISLGAKGKGQSSQNHVSNNKSTFRKPQRMEDDSGDEFDGRPKQANHLTMPTTTSSRKILFEDSRWDEF